MFRQPMKKLRISIVTQVIVAGRGSRALLISALVAVALISLSIPFRITAQTYGNTLGATLLLFISLAMDLWRLKQTGPSAQTVT